MTRARLYAAGIFDGVSLGRIILGAVFVFIVALSSMSAFAHSAKKPPANVTYPTSGFGGPFSLIDHQGKTVSDRNFHGKILVVYFGYTHCPDICPIDVQNIGQALDVLGDRASNVQPLFITIDPARDTSERLADWLGAFHPSFVGLTGSPEQIAAVARRYKVVFEKMTSGAGYDYSMNHPGLTYVMDRDGHFLFLIPPGASPQLIAQEIGSISASGR